MESEDKTTLQLSYRLSELDDIHPKSDNIPGLNISLMNHQKTSIYHCEILERNNGFHIDWNEKNHYYEYYREDDVLPYRVVFSNFGVIACKVGSGKSFVALGLVIKRPLVNFERIVSSERNQLCFSFKKMNSNNFTVSTNLFLVPHNLFNQWKTYINTHTNLDSHFISTKKDFATIEKNMEEYHSLMDELKILMNEVKTDESKLGLLEEKLHQCENKLKIISENKVYLVSSKMWNHFSEKWSHCVNRKVSRIFIDEVHSIALPNSIRVKTNFIWFITSSLKDLSNHRNMGFIRDTIDSFWNLGKSYQDYLVIRNNDSYVDSSLLLPAPIERKIICRSSVLLNIFAGVITNEIRDMLLAEDIQGVISHLGISAISENEIIKVLCSNLEKELDNAKLMHNAKIQLHYASEQSKQEALQRSQDKITAIEQKIENVKQRIMEANIDPIMHIDIINPVITYCCKNKFEMESLTSYYEFQTKKNGSGSSVSCPLCRNTLDIKKLIYIGEFKKDAKKEETIDPSVWNFEEHTKIENLQHILSEEIPIDKRILIFSEHEGNFHTISEAFSNAGRNNLSALKGTVAHISSLIDKYNSGQIPNLFLNARHCGSGLNLEKTDVVIIMHNMSVDNIKQVIGRSQRIGRTSQLKVYYLFTNTE